jgi:hypothetical protein
MRAYGASLPVTGTTWPRQRLPKSTSWRPSTKGRFSAISSREPFFIKSHSPRSRLVGGGFSDLSWLFGMRTSRRRAVTTSCPATVDPETFDVAVAPDGERFYPIERLRNRSDLRGGLRAGPWGWGVVDT